MPQAGYRSWLGLWAGGFSSGPAAAPATDENIWTVRTVQPSTPYADRTETPSDIWTDRTPTPVNDWET